VKLSILLRTRDHRGDHDADVAIAFEPRPGETVEELAKRVFSEGRGQFPTKRAIEVIELRVVQETL